MSCAAPPDNATRQHDREPDADAARLVVWAALAGLILTGCASAGDNGRPSGNDQPKEDGGALAGRGGSGTADTNAATGPDARTGNGGTSGGSGDAAGGTTVDGGVAPTPDGRVTTADASADQVVAADSATPTDVPGVDGVAAGKFECTQVHGYNVTGDWFDAGFETFVDGDRWQVKGVHEALIENWANPNHALWRESGCDPNHTPCETRSKCAGGKRPDRILFVTDTGPFASTTQATWEMKIKAAMDTIRIKYPSVKRIELITFARSPEGQMCGGRANIPPSHDAAHHALAAASNGAVTVAPIFRMMSCAQFAGPPYLTAAGNRYMAELIGKHYAKE